MFKGLRGYLKSLFLQKMIFVRPSRRSFVRSSVYPFVPPLSGVLYIILYVLCCVEHCVKGRVAKNITETFLPRVTLQRMPSALVNYICWAHDLEISSLAQIVEKVHIFRRRILVKILILYTESFCYRRLILFSWPFSPLHWNHSGKCTRKMRYQSDHHGRQNVVGCGIRTFFWLFLWSVLSDIPSQPCAAG